MKTTVRKFRPSAPYSRRLYVQHSAVGGFYVSEFTQDHPDGLPWFCCGRYYATALRAAHDFIRRYYAPEAPCCYGIPYDESRGPGGDYMAD